ncbi:MAG TPA: chlorophyll synthase ChlG [Acidocella sp.]|nr:MAG: bacteriochlorophyll/chlorophyll a synthase [Acidocella sp. 20-58-15]HQT38965.1 chlorophyll synthase ChlG [Acidocella sp.]
MPADLDAKLSLPASDFGVSLRRVPSLKTCLELLKPVTWFAPIWAFLCGTVSSGAPFSQHWPMIIAGLLLAGPMVCGTSQAVNDWFDRHVDAINEPNRPIPSGRMPGRWGLYIGIIWTGASLLLAATLGVWGFSAAIVALLLAWAYSAPPLRLKRNGWWGNAAVAICYEGVPWFTGAAIMTGALPNPPILLIALLYSLGAHGIMTLNDFKSIEGDRQSGIKSLPAMLGAERAANLACVVMILPQIIVILAMLFWHHPVTAVTVTLLTVVQLFLMVELLDRPRERAIWYNATGTTLYVMGMLVCAFALAHGVAA